MHSKLFYTSLLFVCLFQYILRHYVIQHKMNEKWLTEALAERGIKYAPVRMRSKPGKVQLCRLPTDLFSF